MHVVFLSGHSESPCNWECFLYQSDSGRRDSGEPIYYYHWLPPQLNELRPEQEKRESLLSKFYKEFDTLSHVTTFENASSILQYGFKPRPVNDCSVVKSSYDLMDFKTGDKITPRPLHPIRNSSVLWYGPCEFKQLKNPTNEVERYGNILFSMATLYGYEGIIRDDLKFYFIEIIEYLKTSACRILVSLKDYPSLKRYDPYTIGGPLYIQETKQGRSLHYLHKIICHDGREFTNVLEIMKEQFDASGLQKASSENHFISFFPCKSPRNNVKDLVVKNESMDVMSYLVPNILKLAVVLSFGKPLHSFLMITPFDDAETRNKKLRDELKRVHQAAVQRMREKENDRDIIGLAVQGVGRSFMSKRDIVESYCDLLNLIPETQRSTLADTLWEKIKGVLKDPMKQ